MAMKDAQPGSIQLKDYEVPRYLIDKTVLRIEIGPEDATVHAILTMRRNPDSDYGGNTLVLSGQSLNLVSIAIDGQLLPAEAYSLTAEEMIIHQVPDQFELVSEVTICPKENTSLEGLFKSRTMYCTQCEAEGFRRITYYLDRPDVMSEFTTTVVADKSENPVLLANGNLVDSGEMGDGRHWATWHDPFRKPAYLFAMVAGELSVVEDSFTTCSGRDVAIRVYVEPKDLDKCGHAIQSLKQAMAWDEQVYGREYDLDLYMIVAVDDFNMGAMENKGLNIFNTSCVLAHPETTTDDAFKRVEGVVAHEYFHNWSGNRVTCRDWFQLSLKEGFTVFRDAEFSADMGSRTVKRVEDINLLRTVQFAEDAGPTAHPVRPDAYMEISNFYTVTIYEKGAEVVRMIHTLLGPALFRQGSDLYFARHDGQAVTIEDFVAAMAEVSGRDFSQFMNWYRQAGTPKLSVRGEYDPTRQQYRLHFKQSCAPTKSEQDSEQSSEQGSAKRPYHIPVKLGLVTAQGDLPLSADGQTEQVLEITEPEQTIVFEGIDQHPVPSLLRGFSAPVKLDYPYNMDELALLMSHDSDGVNRWNASQQLAIQLMTSLMTDFREGKPLVMDSRLSDAFSRVLTAPVDDRAMQALVLTLPLESLLAELSEEIDVEAIHEVRQFLCRELGIALEAQWRTIYHANQPQGSYEHTASEVARRSLKNLALRYLSYAAAEDSLSLLQAQFSDADNMTDRLSALTTLINDPRPEAQTMASASLARFYEDWNHEPLVLNQWFQIQSACALPGGLARVEALLEHSAFDLHNPNKVRSVIGVFCNSNPVNFHCKDGSGYRFLADQVLTLDKLNPQIAARLLTPLTRWRRFAEGPQQLMQAELARIMAEPGLSKDTFEIVSKSI
jgi:aminopeptidase N